MLIDRCVCTQQTFAQLLERANAEGLSLTQLVTESGASACCGMCGPYLRRAYRCGQTRFDRLLAEGDEPPAGAADRCVAGPISGR
jgi:hypothetical protein